MTKEQIIEELNQFIVEWRRREKDSPYGFDDTGDRKPALDGFECADELEQLIKRAEQW